MKSIALKGKYGNGLSALVDDDDFPTLDEFTWYGHVTGYPQTHMKVRGKWRNVRMHQVVLGMRHAVVDHIDRDRLNTQKRNLRPCDKGQNRANTLPNRNRRFKGAHKHCGAWQSIIRKDGLNYTLGTFSTEHQAALMYDFWATYLHGEYAGTNFKVVSQWTAQ